MQTPSRAVGQASSSGGKGKVERLICAAKNYITKAEAFSHKVKELEANKTHYEVGKKVRKTIKELGGTMPENLPVTDSIKKVERKVEKEKKKLGKNPDKLDK